MIKVEARGREREIKTNPSICIYPPFFCTLPIAAAGSLCSIFNARLCYASFLRISLFREDWCWLRRKKEERSLLIKLRLKTIFQRETKCGERSLVLMSKKLSGWIYLIMLLCIPKSLRKMWNFGSGSCCHRFPQIRILANFEHTVCSIKYRDQR